MELPVYVAVMISPAWRIAVPFSLLLLLLTLSIRRPSSKPKIIGFALLATVQAVMAVSDIATGVMGGDRYDWPSWVLWSVVLAAVAMFLGVCTLVFRRSRQSDELKNRIV
jgi:hypothetical protein